MSTDTATPHNPSFAPLERAARALVVLTLAEAVIVAAYLVATDTSILSARHLVYPFVWVNAAASAVVSAPIPRVRDRWTGSALAVAVGYFLVVCWAGGLLAVGHETGVGVLAVHPAPPGWGPILTLTGGWVHLTIVPFKIVGYAGLAALMYAAIARASRSAVSGVLGLVTCVSCTGSVLAALFTGTIGGSSVAVSSALTRSYGFSSAIFLFTISAMWVGLRR